MVNPVQITNSYIGLSREEDNHYFLFYPAIYPKPHFLNETTFEIWKLCDGRSVDDIFSVMEKMYRNVPKDKLKKDVMDAILVFRNLGMVDFKEDVDMDRSIEKSSLLLFDESDYIPGAELIQEIYNDTKNEERFILSPSDILFLSNKDAFLSYYKAINIRTNQLHRSEIYLNYLNADAHKASGVIGLQVPYNAKISYLTTLICKNVAEVIYILSELEQMLSEKRVQLIKVKWSSHSGKQYEDIFRGAGFSQECILTKETLTAQDIIVYTKVLNH